MFNLSHSCQTEQPAAGRSHPKRFSIAWGKNRHGLLLSTARLSFPSKKQFYTFLNVYIFNSKAVRLLLVFIPKERSMHITARQNHQQPASGFPLAEVKKTRRLAGL